MRTGRIDGDDSRMAGREALVVRVGVPCAGKEDDVLVPLSYDSLDGIAYPTVVRPGDAEGHEDDVGHAQLPGPEDSLPSQLSAVFARSG